MNSIDDNILEPTLNTDKFICDCFFNEILTHPDLIVRTFVNINKGTKEVYFRHCIGTNQDKNDYKIKIFYEESGAKWHCKLYKNNKEIIGQDNILTLFAELNLDRHLLKLPWM